MNINRFYYSMAETEFSNIHSFIRKAFLPEIPKFKISGIEKEGLFIITSPECDAPKKGLILTEGLDLSIAKYDNLVYLTTVVAFYNRGDRQKRSIFSIGGKEDAAFIRLDSEYPVGDVDSIFPEFLCRYNSRSCFFGHELILGKLYRLAGVVPLGYEKKNFKKPEVKLCFAKNTQRSISKIKISEDEEKSFNVENIFSIEGRFRVDDEKKFTRALVEGIGSKRSYGLGAVLARRLSSHETERIERKNKPKNNEIDPLFPL